MEKVTDSINSVENRLTQAFLSFIDSYIFFDYFWSRICELTQCIAAPSSAARTPGSSWEPTRLRCGGCGRRNAAKLEPEDLSGNLLVQLGAVTEDLNRNWYEANTGQVITDVQKHVCHPTIRFMAATMDGRVWGSGAVFEAKFMLPWSFSEEAAAAKYMPQLQHNMWVVTARTAVLSMITGGGKWVEITTAADPLYQHLIVTAERSSGAASKPASRRACSASTCRRRASPRSARST